MPLSAARTGVEPPAGVRTMLETFGKRALLAQLREASLAGFAALSATAVGNSEVLERFGSLDSTDYFINKFYQYDGLNRVVRFRFFTLEKREDWIDTRVIL